MASTNFQDGDASTPVVAAWLNDVNIAVYTALGNAGVAPKTAEDVKVNLGIGYAKLNNQTGTAYTLQAADDGADVICTNSSAFVLTVPPNSAVPFPLGTLLTVSQGGAGIVTLAGGIGVTLVGANGFITGAQYDSLALEQISSNTWRVL